MNAVPLACPCARWALLSTEQHELERRHVGIIISWDSVFLFRKKPILYLHNLFYTVFPDLVCNSDCLVVFLLPHSLLKGYFVYVLRLRCLHFSSVDSHGTDLLFIQVPLIFPYNRLLCKQILILRISSHGNLKTTASFSYS